ncbi:cell division protein FtsQ/DivIB [Acinetobacter rudis]|uniref:Cell division protein FtsQ n=1 Tax=Acinetobacter rudis TaxID=632955 RepID=A0AAW8J2L1_9GAMM|nr:cell division protein FtsQ/DivIB [Acinetobacter rudis]MDQ8934242.1 cell division protein FtsQ/DivIB [Acinetobacter rudis]MDQ8952601.1 cell division protein FtsQ/DivIB [Acinetobacter rudis]MDQ9016450.1 cell division protein FtsQ/DivIB [Acinetobacter rudis]
MAQLPASMRPKRAAITSIHEKPPTRKDKFVNLGGWVLLVIAVVVLLAGIFGLYKVMTDARVAALNVVGISSDVEKQYIVQHLQPVVQNNYFTSDLEQIRDRTLEIPWVDRVVVSRTWPNSISVRIVPRHAIARWGTGRLLSDAGVVFTEATAKDNSKLPMLHGPLGQSKVMMRRYNEINQLFQPAQLRLKDLYLTDRMTWFMQFDSGLRVIVDQDQTMSKLQRLNQLVQSDLKPVWSQVAAIDLRYRNGLAIQWKNSMPPKIVNGQFVYSTVQTSETVPISTR